jgi:hypothetical protein
VSRERRAVRFERLVRRVEPLVVLPSERSPAGCLPVHPSRAAQLDRSTTRRASPMPRSSSVPSVAHGLLHRGQDRASHADRRTDTAVRKRRDRNTPAITKTRNDRNRSRPPEPRLSGNYRPCTCGGHPGFTGSSGSS